MNRSRRIEVVALMNLLPVVRLLREQDGFPVYGQLGPDGVEMLVSDT